MNGRTRNCVRSFMTRRRSELARECTYGKWCAEPVPPFPLASATPRVIRAPSNRNAISFLLPYGRLSPESAGSGPRLQSSLSVMRDCPLDRGRHASQGSRRGSGGDERASCRVRDRGTAREDAVRGPSARTGRPGVPYEHGAAILSPRLTDAGRRRPLLGERRRQR